MTKYNLYRHVVRHGLCLAFLAQPRYLMASDTDALTRSFSVRDKVSSALQTQNQQRERDSQWQRTGVAAKLAQTLGNSASAGQMGELGMNMASGVLSSALQQSLAPFGTASVRLNLSQPRLNGSEFDLLLPLYENRSHLFFTQTGLRRLDDRTMANLGAGYRFWPTDQMMLGTNLFYDYDISRKHKRFGAGLEYAQDYFRLSTNGYFRISDWKRSPDFADYHERVANGFDIRSQAWLPSYPQLGGKLSWSQFYGDQVGIFGPDSLQKNPQVLTMGLEYTPVPLAGISVQKSVNTNGGSDEFSVGLNVSWQMGVPLKMQLDPDQVRFRRTLAQSRYDLVDRNNNIILEYKKDRLFSTIKNQQVSGTESTNLVLNLDVKSRYSLSGISWHGADYFAAGGVIAWENNGYILTLPEWNETGNNHYVLEGRAMDAKGHLSEPFSVDVDVLPMNIKISLAGEVKGEEGQTLALGLNARTENGIGRVEWRAAEFTGAGGKFIQTQAKSEEDYSLNYYAVLPPYKADGANEYAVQVTVTDSKGNISNTASTKITVEPRSVILSVPESVSGTEGARIRLPLTVDAKNPVTGVNWDASEFVASGGQVSVAKEGVWLTLPAWSPSGSNQYKLTLTATDGQNHSSAPVTTQISVASASIDFILDSNLSGLSGEQLVLEPKVQSSAGIDRIDWDADSFLNAGGRIAANGQGGYLFTLPLWQKNGSNRYLVRATAWDKQGHSSAVQSMTIEVKPVDMVVSAPEKLTGVEQGQVKANISVVSHNTTVSDVQFSADDFFAAGGKITGNMPDYQLVLPAWTSSGSNTYQIAVTGSDTKGNVSEPAVISVAVEQAPLTLTADTAVSGTEKSKAVITPVVDSLYGVDRYEVDASAFKSAGGLIDIHDGAFTLTLPGFVVGGDNRYPVTITAVDKRGRRSAPLELNVVVTTRLLGADGQCSVVGGGTGYAGQIDRNSVNYQEARDYATLKALTDSGAPYIYIPGDAEIDIPLVQNALFVKSGTTIFSDRGINGSQGARLNVAYIDEKAYKFPVIVMDSNTRLSGLRYEGPYQGTTTANTTIGIQSVAGSSNIEVDNMELWGWPWAAVSVKQATNLRVHHNYIHNNIKSQLGYGVVTQNGNATAEVACNVFDSNRHSIAGSGQSGEGYAAHHNLVLNGGGRGAYHQFDMHLYPSQNIAGEFMDITQNWFDYGRYGTSNRSSIGVRGQPERGPITVNDNWFSQGWIVGSQRAVAGQYGTWVPTEESILATNQFNVNFKYLDKGNNQCVIDWLSYSQSVNCHGVGY